MKFERDQDKIICNKRVIARMTVETPTGNMLVYANLLSAAPELLEALKSVWAFIEDVPEDDPERTDKFFKLREQVRKVFSEVYGNG